MTIWPNSQKTVIRPPGESTVAKLTNLSRGVSELPNLSPNPRQPFMGELAFAHKGGVHVDAMLKNPRLYEHVDPEMVGNRRRILVFSDLAGTAHIEALEIRIKSAIPLRGSC